MRILQGIAASPGVAIGEALIIQREGFRIPQRLVPPEAVPHELERLAQALRDAARDMERHQRAAAKQLGPSYSAIFAAQLELVRDRRLAEELNELVGGQRRSAEYAVHQVLGRYAESLRRAADPHLAERAHDLLDIRRALLRRLAGGSDRPAERPAGPAILAAHQLAPAELAKRTRGRAVLGLALETGGPGGHTAIVSRGLELPAVVGLGRMLDQLVEGQPVILDGDEGRLIVDPDEATLARYRREADALRVRVRQLRVLRDLPAVTQDGQTIHLRANIEFPEEVEACRQYGAEGVGLYRTEFLYTSGEGEPTEETHFQAYRRVVEAMDGKPVVIRTLDLGADKLRPGGAPEDAEAPNPVLGLRSIRLSLRQPAAFRTQLRAILRASALGDVRLLFPLISTLRELRQARMLLAAVMDDLKEEGVPFNRRIPVGMMVEVPSAVVMLDRFLPEVDFLSIGTNDLIQYALAADRSNRDVADLYRHSDPAVLRLIDMTLRAARQAGRPVNVCGQMSGNPAYAVLLLGLGLREFSAPPAAVPEVKRICRSVRIADCEAAARRALSLDTAREVDVYLRETLRKLVPESLAS